MKKIDLGEVEDCIKALKKAKFSDKENGKGFQAGYNYAIWELTDWLKLQKFGPTRKPPRKPREAASYA